MTKYIDVVVAVVFIGVLVAGLFAQHRTAEREAYAAGGVLASLAWLFVTRAALGFRKKS